MEALSLNQANTLKQGILCSKCGKPGEFRAGSGSRQCLECMKTYYKVHNAERHLQRVAYREAHRNSDRPAAAVRHKRERVDRLREIERLKSVPCPDCEVAYPYYVMDFDHLDPRTKLDKISRLSSKAGKSWPLILAEIAKCEVVCANCHRLRTQTTDSLDPRKRLIAALKDTPCVDCGRTFHYCQMDFDHVRGVKIGNVSGMTSKKAILAESLKCDVVCANCHRERTQKVVVRSPALSDQDMTWKHRSSGPMSRAPIPNDIRVVQPFHDLVGKVSDHALARLIGTTFQTVFRYRSRMGISAHKVVEPQLRPWHASVGKKLDTEVAKEFDVSVSTVGAYREKMGIPKFEQDRPWHKLAGILSDLEISRKFGISDAAVYFYRKQLGIPSFRSSKQMNTETAHV